MSRARIFTLATAICFALLAAYVVERAGIVDLPGIANDYLVAAMLAITIAMIARIPRATNETDPANG